MISETAPAQTHHQAQTTASDIKDRAFVSLYNDTDISEYLYKQPAFQNGFLPLEPEPEQTKQSHAATTPQQTTTKTTAAATPLKSAMKTSPQSTPAKVVERRPSFIEVSVPHSHQHQHEHKHQHQERRHSSETHPPMNWWPETENVAQHTWVERNQVSSDEKEDVIEETFYASY
ncbi:hypothetical protein EDD37DRAFT_623702 [Exophiala viscosa]|uniref:Uncharacterized protein n=1 Tax=Exophiala viscosa TaxID=2486360 RepID=A0AAN6E8S5_9EURO|nr:hypothetical protein EDD36DRAFT_460424 [Exophiala viscosa]KAI1627919.1 hypothetical protein EDD37DRAFT_623702 [Exophiala viscosa]